MIEVVADSVLQAMRGDLIFSRQSLAYARIDKYPGNLNLAMSSSPQALQFIHVPHRPVHSDVEIKNDLAPALSTLLK